VDGARVLALVDAGTADPTTGANLAGEPHGSLALDGVEVHGMVVTSERADEFRARFALARAVQMSAALEQALRWTVQYAGERQQFGRPLAAFQAIQMQLAEMAGAVGAAAAATDAAVEALDRGSPEFVLAAAAAKTAAGSAVEVVARLAHQVHGAIGFTEEHRLHHLTRRLWAWRDEAGSELAWSRELGARLTADDGGLWAALTRLG
jgi:acyl-CoA dehydrogenase